MLCCDLQFVFTDENVMAKILIAQTKLILIRQCILTCKQIQYLSTLLQPVNDIQLLFSRQLVHCCTTLENILGGVFA
jgi:hypothetical protein